MLALAIFMACILGVQIALARWLVVTLTRMEKAVAATKVAAMDSTFAALTKQPAVVPISLQIAQARETIAATRAAETALSDGMEMPVPLILAQFRAQAAVAREVLKRHGVEP